MNRKSYRWCVVPQCTNTSKNTPEKLFIIVPSKTEIRRNWLRLAGRYDASQISTTSSIYFCEDHFDLPSDMENYIKYRIMGSVKKIRMKAGCVPSKFDCLPSRKKTLQPSTSSSQSVVVTSREIDLFQESDAYPQYIIESPILITQDSFSSKSGVLKSMVTITEAEHNYCFRVMPPSLPATSPTLIDVLHRFPKPEGSSLERFIQWKEIVGQRLAGKSALDIYTNFRICNHHFEDRFFYSHSKRLAKTSYPTLNLGQYDVVERTDAPKNQTDKDVPGPSKPLEPNISNKTNVASKTDPSTAKIYGDLKADDNLDSADNEGFDSCLYFTIEDVPLEPPKEFSWQETKATVDLADDGDDIQDDLSLYCSDDEEKPPVYENSEDPGAHIGFHCNVCKKEIVGFRYVCVQCSDFDLCGGCEAQGAHHQHYVLRVPGPRPHREVQSVLARIRKQLMASMDPIQVADDAISIKSEVKDEDEEMLLQEADTIRVREETENGNEKENQETSQDEGETSQEEADPLRTHNNSEAESSVDDSEAEWRPSKEDLADLERTDHDFPSNMRRYTRTRLTNIKPSTEEMPPRSNIEQSDKGQQTFKNKTQVIKIKPLPTNVAQAKLRIIQSNSGANVIPLPVSQVDPKIVLNRINLDKLTKPIMAENASLKKRRIIMSTSDFEKFLTMQQPAKKVFTAGVSGNNIATSHRQPSNIYASSSKTNNDDTIR